MFQESIKYETIHYHKSIFFSQSYKIIIGLLYISACNSCYDGIDSQFASLDTFNTNLTNYVEMLVSQNQEFAVEPFMQRLTSIQTLLLDLVIRVGILID